jgi:L-threonine-O-3-phosphate decarboxylase
LTKKRPLHGGNLDWAASIAGCPPSLLLDFSASINPLGPPKTAIAAIQEGLASLKSYPDPNYGRLCSLLAQEHDLTPDWILPGNGSAELLTWASWELAKIGKIALLTPAFGDYQRAFQTFAVARKLFPLDLVTGSWEIDSEVSGLLLNNPHNPTGKLWSREMIIPYLEKLALVVVDEAFMDFLPPDQQQSLIPLIENYPNLVVLRSLTKFYSLPGLRLGYAVSHPDRLKQWQQWRDPWPVNILAAIASEAVIQDRDFQQKTWKWLISARNDLFQGLASLPSFAPLPGSANFLLVKTTIPSTEIQLKLLTNSRILIRDCLSFPELGDQYFRVAVRLPQENQRLLDGLSYIL